MTVSFHINPADLARVKEHLDPEKLLLPPVRELLRSAAEFGVREIGHDAPQDSGAIARSFTAEVHGLEATIVSKHPGAAAVNFGRRPGDRMPPPDGLRAWAARHGLEGLEFVIAQAIARRGIKGTFFVGRTLQRLHDHEMPQLLRAAIGKIEATWSRK